MSGTEVLLGKIVSAHVGYGGYQGVQFGMFLMFKGESWGTATGECEFWKPSMERSEHANWTEADRAKVHTELCAKIDATLTSAKVERVSQLAGIPVEVTFEDRKLTSWRILEEVL